MILSIIIPAYNEEKYLQESIGHIIQALHQIGIEESEWELIVCDNNSTDRTAQVANQMGAHVVFEIENQISRARNTGARNAKGDWLLFIDADSYPTPELMNEVFQEIKQDKIIGCGSTVRIVNGPLFSKLKLERLNIIYQVLNISGGAFLLCRKSAFEGINGFSNTLFAYEEVDFIKRLKKYGSARGQKFKVLLKNPIITSGRKGDLNWKSLYRMVSSLFVGFILYILHYLLPGKMIQSISKKLLPYWYSDNR